jgi:hypothetical protein
VLSAALKKGKLSEEGYAELIRHTCKLNKPGMALSKLEGVHAMTDVLFPHSPSPPPPPPRASQKRSIPLANESLCFSTKP